MEVSPTPSPQEVTGTSEKEELLRQEILKLNLNLQIGECREGSQTEKISC